MKTEGALGYINFIWLKSNKVLDKPISYISI